MAKRKRSTALFEVISKSRQYRPARPATARSSNWFSHATTWFVRPKLAPVTTRAVAAQEMDYDHAPVAVFEEPPDIALPPETPDEKSLTPVNQDIAPSAHEPNVHVTMDSDRRQIRLNLSYTAAAVAAMVLLAVVCVSVIIGQRFGKSDMPLLTAQTTDELRHGPAHREVLDPPRRTAPTVPSKTVSIEGKAAVPAAKTEVASGNPPLPAGNRYIGMNYVVIQSYPEKESDLADKTAAFLNNHGVNCTVEHNVKGFLPLTVVGLDGFPKRSSPEYKAYVDHLAKLSTEFTSNSHSYKAFDPIAKKWEKAE